MNDAPKYAGAAEANQLGGSVGQLQALGIGSDGLFDGLVKGTYDAIVVDSAAALYYMR